MEIKASELRIGNLVSWNSINLIITCVNIDYCIGYDSKKDDLIHDNSSKSMFKPIPLTEEWLLKFGFEESKRVSYSNGEAEEYFIYYKDKLLFNNIQDSWYYSNLKIIKIKHVHQLQNLYFALTNQELTLNK